MIDPIRRKLIELIEELSETCPDYRLGQMILNLAYMAREDGERGLWNLADEELIAAARKHLDDWGDPHRSDIADTENETVDAPDQREGIIVPPTSRSGRVTSIRTGEETYFVGREVQADVTKDAIVAAEVRLGRGAIKDTAHISGRVREEVKGGRTVKSDQTGEVHTRGTGDTSR